MGVLVVAGVREIIDPGIGGEVQVEAIPEGEERVQQQVSLNVLEGVVHIAHPLLIHLMLRVIDQDMVK